MTAFSSLTDATSTLTSAAKTAARTPVRTAAKTAVSAAAAIALACGLSACGGSADSSSAGSDSTQGQHEVAAQALTIADAWVKATDDTMTGMFGVVTNNSEQDIQITGGTTPVAGAVELHETAADGAGGMSMRQKEGGFTVAPGQSLTFQPGGDHIMLMQLEENIEAGDSVKLTLQTSAGDFELEFVAKEFSGAQENYAPGDHASHGADTSHGAGEDSHEGHDHAGHEHGSSESGND